MSLDYVTLVCDLYDGAGNVLTQGVATLAPSGVLTDVADHMEVGLTPVTAAFKVTGPPSVRLLATSNAALLPAGWAWVITPPAATGIAAFSFFLDIADGSTQYLSALTPVSAGGTLTGPLVISGTPGAAPSRLPVGYGNSEALTGLQIASSYPSDDVGGGTDGTGRINLYSFQRANTYSFGETIRNFLMRWDAKANAAWYGPASLYDGSGNAVTSGGWKPWTWIGSHYESNGHTGIHGHWEIEVPDSTGALQGRFEVLFANQTTGVIGLDQTKILTNLADFVVRCHGTDHLGADQVQQFRLSGVAGFEKAIVFCNDTDAVARRWLISSNATAESGANAGSDLRVVRYDDTGVLIDQPVVITRSSGLVTIGGTSGTSAGLLVTRASGIALTVTPTATGGQAVLVTGTDATAAAYQANVAGDAVNRFRVYADGKHEWGDGTLARDVTLARSGAGVLAVTGALTVSGALTVTGAGGITSVTRTTDQTATQSSNTLANDDTLVLAVAASATYELKCFIIYDSGTVPDIQFAFTGPSGATLDWTTHALGTAAAGGTGSVTVTRSPIGSGNPLAAGGAGAGAKVVASIEGIVKVSSTAGNLQLMWAQNTGDASNTVVRANSAMRLLRIS